MPGYGEGVGKRAVASTVYLLLFAPFGVFFAGEGLPYPYSMIIGTLILIASWAVGWVIGSLWALVLPAIPWTTALILIAIAPEEDFGEVTRRGSMILWSMVFVFLAALVVAGVLMARRRAPNTGPVQPPGT